MKTTLAQTIRTLRAARTHEAAISRPGARCSESPCSICAAVGTATVDAIDADLDELASCPKWLGDYLAQARALGDAYLAYLREGRRARFGGTYFFE